MMTSGRAHRESHTNHARADSAAKSAETNATWEGTTWRIYRQVGAKMEAVLACRHGSIKWSFDKSATR